MAWSVDDGAKVRAIINDSAIYSGRIGGATPSASISLAIGSTDALELEVLMADPEFETKVGTEVTLNDELVRHGIASLGSPSRSSDSTLYSTPTLVEQVRLAVSEPWCISL